MKKNLNTSIIVTNNTVSKDSQRCSAYFRKELRCRIRPLTYTTPSTPATRKPDRTSSKVDFPAPDGPIKAINCLLGSLPLIPCKISFCPKI